MMDRMSTVLPATPPRLLRSPGGDDSRGQQRQANDSGKRVDSASSDSGYSGERQQRVPGSALIDEYV